MTKNRNPYAFELMELLVADYKMRKGPIGQQAEPTETALGDVTQKRDRSHIRGNGNGGRSCWKCGSNDHIRNDCPLLNCKYPGCQSRKRHSTEECFWNLKNASKRPSWFKKLMVNKGGDDEPAESDTVEILI